MTHAARETEIKLAVPDAKTARGLLRAAGFRVSKRRVFETNTVFDTPELSLRRAATLLRVRQAGGVATVTYKGPPVVARHKSREELELEISDARAMGAIIERLGLGPVFRYEKYRTEYRQPGRSGNCHAGRDAGGRLPGAGRNPAMDRPRRAEIGIRGGRLHHRQLRAFVAGLVRMARVGGVGYGVPVSWKASYPAERQAD